MIEMEEKEYSEDIKKILRRYMEKMTKDLGGNPMETKEEIHCPICKKNSEDIKLVFQGWSGDWVDYDCPHCGFIMSFRWNWDDRDSVCSMEGYDIPKETYTLIEESDTHWYFRDLSKVRMKEILEKKGYNVGEVLRLPEKEEVK